MKTINSFITEKLKITKNKLNRTKMHDVVDICDTIINHAKNNNDFIECFTAIAFNGPFRHSIIQGNKHIRTDKFTTFLRVRPVATTGQLENVKIIDNMLDGKLDYHIIGLRDTINVTIANNIFFNLLICSLCNIIN